MKSRSLNIALLIALVCAFAVAPLQGSTTATAAPRPNPNNGTPVPITGTFTDTLGGTGTFNGTFYLQKFTSSGTQMSAVGTLVGTLTDSLGTVLGSVTQSATLPAAITGSTCTILDLTVGPLDLNLLGLMVHLNQVHLEVTAQQGPGNLLGNLLCALTGLLDNGLPLNIVVSQLNVIVDALKQLGLGFLIV